MFLSQYFIYSCYFCLKTCLISSNAFYICFFIESVFIFIPFISDIMSFFFSERIFSLYFPYSENYFKSLSIKLNAFFNIFTSCSICLPKQFQSNTMKNALSTKTVTLTCKAKIHDWFFRMTFTRNICSDSFEIYGFKRYEFFFLFFIKN